MENRKLRLVFECCWQSFGVGVFLGFVESRRWDTTALVLVLGPIKVGVEWGDF